MVFKQFYKPFNSVERIEHDITQLAHLRGMYLLVIHYPLCQNNIFSDKEDNAEEVQSSKPFQGNDIIEDYFHTFA